MSEKNKSDDEPMVPAGYEGQASLYGEEQWIHHYSTLSDAVLADKAQRMIALMNDPATLPKHRAIAARIIDHIVFETTYRDVKSLESAPDNLEGIV